MFIHSHSHHPHHPHHPGQHSGSDSNADSDSDDFSPGKMSAADRSLAAFLENEPTYFSMYDKVKARSLKLQQQKRQEEERKSVQQQQQDKFNALRLARIASTSKRANDGIIFIERILLLVFTYFFLSIFISFIFYVNFVVDVLIFLKFIFEIDVYCFVVAVCLYVCIFMYLVSLNCRLNNIKTRKH